MFSNININGLHQKKISKKKERHYVKRQIIEERVEKNALKK